MFYLNKRLNTILTIIAVLPLIIYIVYTVASPNNLSVALLFISGLPLMFMIYMKVDSYLYYNRKYNKLIAKFNAFEHLKCLVACYKFGGKELTKEKEKFIEQSIHLLVLCDDLIESKHISKSKIEDLNFKKEHLHRFLKSV